MKRTALFLILSGMMFLHSCNSTRESEVDVLKREVIAVHDEVMPLMGELRAFQRSLDEKAAELRSEGADESAISPYLSASKACAEAYEGMFVWMRQFDVKLEKMDEVQSLAYLKDQAIKVAKVNEDIKNALRQAESLLVE